MDGERIFGIILMCGIGFGCGSLFYGIGHWAETRKDPMHFYAGVAVDPKTISDIPVYNRANAKMWKQYSIPYWLILVSTILTIWDDRFSIISTILIIIACTSGIGWLLHRYHKILNQYKI